MTVQNWSWVFFIFYTAGMLGFGYWGSRRVKHADDFAVARQSYGPVTLSLAFAATTASGATFLGLPGIAYNNGVSALWYAFGYPLGVYIGVIICLRIVSDSGNDFGSRSIPEYLGDKYNSEVIRIVAAVLSLVLFFYLAGQLVAGLVMFETMLGLGPAEALMITTGVLLLYVVMGGAHADILTDGFQGALMLLIAVGVAVMFFIGYGVEGGYTGLFNRLRELDPNNLSVLHPHTSIVGSPWAVFAIVVAHIPLGMLPHIGNKLWALEKPEQRKKFVSLAFIFGMTLPAMALGGLMARAILGDDLMASGGANQAIPVLFVELLPGWLAALLSIAVLSAVMSTADGLVVSATQVFANDLYRRSWAPRFSSHLSEDELDHRVLWISRVGTIGVLLFCAALAWMLLDMNVALLVWIGIGGMTSAIAGPLMLGSLWSGVTARGALSGMLVGFFSFVALHAKLLPVAWLLEQGPNPYACATLASLTGVAVTVLVSRLTK